MSKLGSKEEILSAIQLHFENIQSGNLTADAMESLVELTRELHERALILRYKSYEEKVFGLTSTSKGSTGADTDMEAAGAGAEPAISGSEQDEPAGAAAEPVETQHSMGFEEVETALLAAEQSIPVEEPVFDFDMFEKAEAASAQAEQPFPVEIQQDAPTQDQQDPEPATAEDHSADAGNESAGLAENKPASNSPQPSEPISAAEASEKQQDIEIPRTEAEQIANEIEESDATVSEQMPANSQPVENIRKEEENQAEIPLPEELAIMNEPVIPEEKPREFQQEENDMFRRLSNTGTSDNSLGSRLAATKLHTLAGAFGLNEKLQCIRELFKGSSEAFNQAIETLDQQENFGAAKRILAQFAQQNSWNLESNLTAEFIQKVERRFL